MVDRVIAAFLLALIICFLIGAFGCTYAVHATDTVYYTPVANACVKVESVDLMSDAVVMPCFDSTGRPMDSAKMASGVAAASPLGAAATVASGAANAAVLGFALPKLTSSTTVTTK